MQGPALITDSVAHAHRSAFTRAEERLDYMSHGLDAAIRAATNRTIESVSTLAATATGYVRALTTFEAARREHEDVSAAVARQNASEAQRAAMRDAEEAFVSSHEAPNLAELASIKSQREREYRTANPAPTTFGFSVPIPVEMPTFPSPTLRDVVAFRERSGVDPKVQSLLTQEQIDRRAMPAEEARERDAIASAIESARRATPSDLSSPEMWPAFVAQREALEASATKRIAELDAARVARRKAATTIKGDSK